MVKIIFEVRIFNFMVILDGYSVSYIISGEDRIYFHISSVKSCPMTSTDRFGKRVCKAMKDMKNLMEEYRIAQKEWKTIKI